MFTGIIQSIGKITDKQPKGGDLCFAISTGFDDMSQVKLGDSIAMDGVCLTVTAIDKDVVTVDVSLETVAKTTVSQWQIGSLLNLEPALRIGDALGGHLVSGHVDAVGHCRERHSDARSEAFVFEIPPHLTKYVADKGSITINGTSLTVNQITDNKIDINLVPHTLQHTNLGQLSVGDSVNIEIDTVARYVERMLHRDNNQSEQA